MIGRLAQLVERLPYKQDVAGSSPSLPINLLSIQLFEYSTFLSHSVVDNLCDYVQACSTGS